MVIAGLTGNFGMGKSSVLSMLKEFGAVVLSADDVVDSLLNEGAVQERVRAVLGRGVFSDDGKLDRARVADVIFRDERLRTDLENILHPMVLQKIREFLRARCREDAKDTIVVIEIPLMFEKGYSRRFNKTITVFTDEETALRRLGAAGVSREDAIMRLKVQMPVEEKIRMSDFAINNNGILKDTAVQAKEIFSRLRDCHRQNPDDILSLWNDLCGE